MNEEQSIARPPDTGEALRNPGMGWVFHYYDNGLENYGSGLDPADRLKDFPGLTVIYFRVPWSLLEPREGVHVWSLLDGPAQRFTEAGYRIAFRVTCSEPHVRNATPEWVRKAGAKGNWFNPGVGTVTRGVSWEPDFEDAVFLAKADAFLAAAAARYDGDGQVEFIDIGSFGASGEGSTFWSTKINYSPAALLRHIDLHCERFKRTLLVANCSFATQGRGVSALEHAARRGLALRDGHILSQGPPNAYGNEALAGAFWDSVPVILESERYGVSRDRGCWRNGREYLRAVEDYHASYVSIRWNPWEFLEQNRDLVQRINQRLGYRICLDEASWPNKVRAGSSLAFASSWRNAGVAPCIAGGYPAITLKDKAGNIAAVFVDAGCDIRDLPVDAPAQAPASRQAMNFPLPAGLAAGEYDLFVSIGSKAGKPLIALPHPDGDGERRYRVGEVVLTPD